MELTDLTVDAIRAGLVAREFSAEELVRATLERIDREDKSIRAYLTLSPERALAKALEIDRRVAAREELPPLAGVPAAVKDVLSTQGLRTTCASRILEHYIPPYDATTVERLEAAGASILGKTNCDEFAMGSSTENSGFFPTHNPRDLSRVPGGSSGGSAAAVASSLAAVALGSDTGGSIRQPASLTGVVGMMGTYGRVSRYGLVAFASSLDHVGPFGRTVVDVARVLGVIAGRDPLDWTSADVPVPDYLAELDQDVRGLKVGVPDEYFAGLSAEIGDNIQKGLDLFARLGLKIERIRMPHTEYAIATYYLIATAEASSNLARYDGVKYGHRAAQPGNLMDMYCRTRAHGFGSEVKRRIMLGTYALSAGYYDAYYLKAQKVRTLIRQDFLTAFAACDVIATPVAPTVAFRLGEKTADPLTMYLSDIFTIAVNLAGLPGLSVPCGCDAKGLPIGLQLIGKPFGEDTLLQAAYAYEQATPWHMRKPPL